MTMTDLRDKEKDGEIGLSTLADEPMGGTIRARGKVIHLSSFALSDPQGYSLGATVDRTALRSHTCRGSVFSRGCQAIKK